MRNGLIVLLMALFSVAPATAQVSIGIGLPTVSIGINLPLYPELVRVPGYPVYYAPRLNSNYFFYDGMYWVYEGDSWYTSSWYNGPWVLADPDAVPVYVLRVPVRYYRQRPAYFEGWQLNAPPRWGEHWGHEWEQRRSGWDRWDRRAVPLAAPLPVYQRNYSGDRYPRAEQQQELHSKHYRYQPHDPVVRQHFQVQRGQNTPESPKRGEQRGPHQRFDERYAQPLGSQRSNPPAAERKSAPTAPHAQPPLSRGENAERSVPPKTPMQRRGENVERSAPTQAPPQRRGPPSQQQSQHPQQGAGQHPQMEPRARGQETEGQGKAAPQEQERGQRPSQERNRGNAEDRGQDHKN